MARLSGTVGWHSSMYLLAVTRTIFWDLCLYHLGSLANRVFDTRNYWNIPRWGEAAEYFMSEIRDAQGLAHWGMWFRRSRDETMGKRYLWFLCGVKVLDHTDKGLCLSHLHTSKVKKKSRVKAFGNNGPNSWWAELLAGILEKCKKGWILRK